MTIWTLFSKFLQRRQSTHLINFRSQISHLENIGSFCAAYFLLNPSVVNSGCDRHQIRWYAARKGKQIKRKQMQRGKKKEVEEKKPFIFPKLRDSNQKILIKPRRYNVEGWLSDNPTDNVFRTKYYKKITYSVQDAVEMHRETHHPTMYNVPDAVLSATVELDMTMKKKNRYMDNFSGILFYPHHFDTGINRKVIVFSKEASDREKALQAGAHIVGSLDIIRQFQAGDITKDDFDFLVAHPDMLADLLPIRGLLRKKFPTMSTGNLTVDIVPAVERFRKGVSYVSGKDEHELDFGWLDIPFAKLDMPVEEIESNLDMLLKTIEKHKPKDTAPGSFITRVLLFSPPSKETFLISHAEYLPDYKYAVKEEASEETEEADEVEEEEKEVVAK